MSIEGLFTIIAFGLGIYALAQPIQRKTIAIFVPPWIIILAVAIPAILLIAGKVLSRLDICIIESYKLVSSLIVLFFPIIGVAVCVLLWRSARLSKNNESKFKDFIYTSLNENSFDELSRILNRNLARISKVLSPESITLIFQKDVVTALNKFPDWMHFSLLTDVELIRKSDNFFGITDVVMRNMISNSASLIQYLAHISHKNCNIRV